MCIRDSGHSVRILFIDYAKAFDHVDHNIVIQKLRAFGVPDFIVRWVSSFLSARQQRVKLSDIFSDWITLNGGMPQGSWLGPLIYIILINDLRMWIYTVNRKNTPKRFLHTVYKTKPIVITFGTYCPE